MFLFSQFALLYSLGTLHTAVFTMCEGTGKSQWAANDLMTFLWSALRETHK